jgi:hypothetical protein
MKAKPNQYIHPSHTFEEECQFIEAVYQASSIPEFAGNPLIEALPQNYYGQETVENFASYPSYSDEQRFMPRSYRLHAVSRLRTFMETLPWHLSVMRDIYKNVWNGYTFRNPLANRRGALQRRYQLAMQKGTILPLEAHRPSHASTFGLLGASGIGKSTVIDLSLKCLPQALVHREHGIVQLVWIKVECPPDGSLKQLMYWILEEVDEVLNSNYGAYITKQMPLDDRMALVGKVLEKHYTGLLVLDEIHNVLRDAKQHYRNIDFFMTFANKIHVPSMHVGLPTAIELYPDNMHSKRRATDSGIRLLPPQMSEREWQLYIKELIRYQWMEELATVEELEEVLREKSQRNPAVSSRIFELAQTIAIETGKKKLSAEFIEMVADTRFTMLRPLIDAIKANNAALVAKYSAALKAIEGEVAQANEVAVNRAQLREMAELRIRHQAITDAATSLLTLGKKQEKVVEKLREFAKKKPGADASWLVSQYLAWESDRPVAADTHTLEMQMAKRMEREQAELRSGGAHHERLC